MPLPPDPFGGSASIAGPSPDFFYLTQAMNDTLPVNTASATPKLPKVLRAIRAVADVTLMIQSRTGGVVALTMSAGGVHDLGNVVAVSGLTSDTQAVGYV